MGLSRRTGARFQGSIWPGFVDAMTGLLLVLMFVLTIFMVVQFVLREEISGQATKLDALGAEVAALSRALGLERDRSAGLEDRVGTLTATLDDAQARQAEQATLIDTLRARTAAQTAALGEAKPGLPVSRNRWRASCLTAIVHRAGSPILRASAPRFCLNRRAFNWPWPACATRSMQAPRLPALPPPAARRLRLWQRICAARTRRPRRRLGMRWPHCRPS